MSHYYTNLLDWPSLWKELHPLPGFQREFVYETNEKGWKTKLFSSYEELKQCVLSPHVKSIHIKGMKDPQRYWREDFYDLDLDSKDEGLGPFKGQSIRVCCGKQKTFCQICWLFAAYAIDFLKIVLQSMFDIPPDSVQAYFSGRRGVHIFVFSEICYSWNTSLRKMVHQTLMYENFCSSVHAIHYEKLFVLTNNYVRAILKQDTYKPFVPIYQKILKEQNNSNLVNLALMFPSWDKQVYMIDHNLRMPLSIHPETKAVNVKIKDGKVPQEKELFP